MNSEAVLALEKAGWPVLLVSESGAIIRANPAAVKTFGSSFEGEMPLSAIWASENGPMAEQFILRWDNSPTAPGPLAFCVDGGQIKSFLTSICPIAMNKEKYFLFQLLPAVTASNPAE